MFVCFFFASISSSYLTWKKNAYKCGIYFFTLCILSISIPLHDLETGFGGISFASFLIAGWPATSDFYSPELEHEPCLKIRHMVRVCKPMKAGVSCIISTLWNLYNILILFLIWYSFWSACFMLSLSSILCHLITTRISDERYYFSHFYKGGLEVSV